MATTQQVLRALSLYPHWLVIYPLDRVIQSWNDQAIINKALLFFFFVKYYEECHGVIYVIDSSDERRLEESQVTFGEYKLLTVLIEQQNTQSLSCAFGSSFNNHYYFCFNNILI